MAAVALPKDDWTPAKLAQQRAWRAKMFGRPQPVHVTIRPKKVEEPALKAMVFPTSKVFGKVVARFPIYWFEGSQEPRTPRMRDILKLVAKAAGMSVDDVTGPRRASNYVRARQIGMMLCAMKCGGASYPAIGRVFHKDHTTAMYAVDKLRPVRDLLAIRVPSDLPLPYLVAAAFDAHDEIFARGE